MTSRKGKSSSSDQLLRHDEHSIKSVRAKIAMFSTQNSVDSLQDTTSSANNSNNNSMLRSTPSPVGNGGRNSLSAQPPSRVITSTPSLNNSVPPSSKKINYDLESKAGMPYHRSMINVSSDSQDIGISQSQSIASEKSQSHADLTKSDELAGYKNQKPHLTRVSSSENAGADVRLRSRALQSYNLDHSQHGRSQSLLEIDSNNVALSEDTNSNVNNTGLFKNNNTSKSNTSIKKIVSDRSQSSSALLITPSIFDETPSSKSNLIHSRRRHTLTKLKGNRLFDHFNSSTNLSQYMIIKILNYFYCIL